MEERGTVVGGHGWGEGGRGQLVAPASASAMSLLLSKPILQEAGPAGMFSAGGMSKIN